MSRTEISHDPLVAHSHKTAPHAAEHKLVQHQANMSAERRVENEKLFAIMASAAQTQRAEIIARVADIIEGTRADPAGTALDWKALKEKLSQFVVETGDSVSRAKWVYEGCTAWRKENIAENSEEQARFDKGLSSWFTDFLGFLGSRK